jgi:hypothetical protein
LPAAVPIGISSPEQPGREEMATAAINTIHL